MIVPLEIDGTSGNPQLEEQLAEVLKEYHELWKTKQRKYGVGNIAAFGRPGLVIRANDKLQRLRNFVFKDIKSDAEGSEEDAWQDLLGYAAMGVMVYRGKWPQAPAEQVTKRQMWHLLKLIIFGGK